VPFGALLGVLLTVLSAAPAAKPAGKVSVSLRAAPRTAAAPARIVFNVELKGGQETEALHCLTLQWDTKLKFEGSADRD
jgi:hypothetical protein